MFDLQLLIWSTLHLILILANPIPQSDPEVDPLLTEDFTASNEIGCTPPNNQNPDIFRRSATICPIAPQLPLLEQAPQEAPQRNPVRTPKQDYDPCRVFGREYKKLVTCGGPEVYLAPPDNRLRWVLNCLWGAKARIPSQSFWLAVQSPARYCCKRYVYNSPYFAASWCMKITPDVLITQWNEKDLEEFKQQNPGTPPPDASNAN